MRIVAGKYRSRQIMSVPGNTTRPTSDKVKGAIFSSLGNSFEGGRMLDCYSGTGNMALEALSRGMDHATCIDLDRKAIQTIQENARNLGCIRQMNILFGNTMNVVERLKSGYDLIYIDPPYKKEENLKLIQKLLDLHLINPQGIVVIESLSEQQWPEQIDTLVKYKEKEYRNTKITYYQKEESQ